MTQSVLNVIKWFVYLNMDVSMSSSTMTIYANEVLKVDETTVVADGIKIDFQNEILGISNKTLLNG